MERKQPGRRREEEEEEEGEENKGEKEHEEEEGDSSSGTSAPSSSSWVYAKIESSPPSSRENKEEKEEEEASVEGRRLGPSASSSAKIVERASSSSSPQAPPAELSSSSLSHHLRVLSDPSPPPTTASPHASSPSPLRPSSASSSRTSSSLPAAYPPLAPTPSPAPSAPSSSSSVSSSSSAPRPALVKFQPFTLSIDVSFWRRLGEKKLHEWRLDTPWVPLLASVIPTIARASAASPSSLSFPPPQAQQGREEGEEEGGGGESLGPGKSPHLLSRGAGRSLPGQGEAANESSLLQVSSSLSSSSPPPPVPPPSAPFLSSPAVFRLDGRAFVEISSRDAVHTPSSSSFSSPLSPTTEGKEGGGEASSSSLSSSSSSSCLFSQYCREYFVSSNSDLRKTVKPQDDSSSSSSSPSSFSSPSALEKVSSSSSSPSSLFGGEVPMLGYVYNCNSLEEFRAFDRKSAIRHLLLRGGPQGRSPQSASPPHTTTTRSSPLSSKTGDFVNTSSSSSSPSDFHTSRPRPHASPSAREKEVPQSRSSSSSSLPPCESPSTSPSSSPSLRLSSASSPVVLFERKDTQQQDQSLPQLSPEVSSSMSQRGKAPASIDSKPSAESSSLFSLPIYDDAFWWGDISPSRPTDPSSSSSLSLNKTSRERPGSASPETDSGLSSSSSSSPPHPSPLPLPSSSSPSPAPPCWAASDSQEESCSCACHLPASVTREASARKRITRQGPRVSQHTQPWLCECMYTSLPPLSLACRFLLVTFVDLKAFVAFYSCALPCVRPGADFYLLQPPQRVLFNTTFPLPLNPSLSSSSSRQSKGEEDEARPRDQEESEKEQGVQELKDGTKEERREEEEEEWKKRQALRGSICFTVEEIISLAQRISTLENGESPFIRSGVFLILREQKNSTSNVSPSPEPQGGEQETSCPSLSSSPRRSPPGAVSRHASDLSEETPGDRGRQEKEKGKADREPRQGRGHEEEQEDDALREKTTTKDVDREEQEEEGENRKREQVLYGDGFSSSSLVLLPVIALDCLSSLLQVSFTNRPQSSSKPSTRLAPASQPADSSSSSSLHASASPPHVSLSSSSSSSCSSCSAHPASSSSSPKTSSEEVAARFSSSASSRRVRDAVSAALASASSSGVYTLYLCYIDPSGNPDALGWPLRNLLFLLSIRFRLYGKVLPVLSFRDFHLHLFLSSSPSSSLLSSSSSSSASSALPSVSVPGDVPPSDRPTEEKKGVVGDFLVCTDQAKRPADRRGGGGGGDGGDSSRLREKEEENQDGKNDRRTSTAFGGVSSVAERSSRLCQEESSSSPSPPPSRERGLNLRRHSTPFVSSSSSSSCPHPSGVGAFVRSVLFSIVIPPEGYFRPVESVGLDTARSRACSSQAPNPRSGKAPSSEDRGKGEEDASSFRHLVEKQKRVVLLPSSPSRQSPVSERQEDGRNEEGEVKAEDRKEIPSASSSPSPRGHQKPSIVSGWLRHPHHANQPVGSEVLSLLPKSHGRSREPGEAGRGAAGEENPREREQEEQPQEGEAGSGSGPPHPHPPPPPPAPPQHHHGHPLSSSTVFVVPLRRYLDGRTIQGDAVDLNVQLIRWRILPDFEAKRLQQLRVLLLGAGTLGCGVARLLLAWGVRHLTFVDSSSVALSNPARQSLYTYDDAVPPPTTQRRHPQQAVEGAGLKKVEAACQRLRAIRPDVVCRGVDLEIPMPGHRRFLDTPAGTRSLEESHDLLCQLIDEHDVVMMLTDSKESRWLPSLIVAEQSSQPFKTISSSSFHSSPSSQTSTSPVSSDRSSFLGLHSDSSSSRRRHSYPPLGMAVGLGFDSMVVMRQGYNGNGLGCYFCNAISAPADSLANRTLDQQCTVTRPGISSLACSVAVELLAALTQHPLGFGAPHSEEDPLVACRGGGGGGRKVSKSGGGGGGGGGAENQGSGPGSRLGREEEQGFSCMGATPHTVRGYLSNFRMVSLASESSPECVCCSLNVLERYRRNPHGFLREVVANSSLLETYSGLEERRRLMEAKGQEAEVICLSDRDEDEGEES